MSEQPTVYLIDDDPALLNLLRLTIEGQGWQTRCFSSAREFLDQGEPRAAGCVVTDVRLPGVTGFDLLNHLVSRRVPVPVILITGAGDVPTGVRAIKSGAINFLTKPFESAELVAAVREALAKSAESLDAGERARVFHQRLSTLTGEELAVLRGIAQGQSNGEIAATLDVSLRTVQFRRASLLEKLSVRTRSDLMSLVLDSGWNPRD